MATQPTPRFLPMRHVRKRTIHRESARAGTWAVACMAQRRRPADWAVRSPLARPLGRQGIDIPPPLPPSRMWLVVSSVLRGCNSSSLPPGACSGCKPGIWGVRRARFGLSIPNGNVLRGRIEGGQGVGQWGVARAWQALRLLDKPTRAVPTSFLSVFDPQPKSAPARSRNSNRNSWHWQATGGAQGYRGSVAGHEEVQEAHPGGCASLLAPLGPQDRV